jgi:integrase
VPWDEIDLEARTWLLPAQRSKNKLANLVPLPEIAIDILRKVPHFQGCRFVFSLNAREPVSEAYRGLNRIREAVGFDDFTIHDLRRTVRSHMSRLRIPREYCEAVLNHISGRSKVERTYDVYEYFDEKRMALEAWAREIERIVSGEVSEGNIVTMARRA